MDLKSGYPVRAVKNRLIHAFPQLDADVKCEVVVVGTGITGALIVDELAGTFAETSDGLPLFGRHPQYGSRVLLI